jgi:hypothetical protein
MKPKSSGNSAREESTGLSAIAKVSQRRVCRTGRHFDFRAYHDALQICIAHGDQARATVCVERLYEA